MPIDFAAHVVRNVDLGARNHLLCFEAPDEVSAAMRPGQFFMVGLPGSEVLLRRPFSVCGLPGTFRDARAGTLQILYRVYGKGTAMLAGLAPGATVQVLGPLGRGFEPPENPRTLSVFVAGGIGSAPFPALAGDLARSGRRAVLLYGGRSRDELPLLGWFREHCEEVRVATEDGSLGHRGLVTALVAQRIAEGGALHLYACGPTPMLKAVASLAIAGGQRCDLSLEAPMACGFGVCLGCVLPCHDGHGGVRLERCCIEGPVMAAERLAW